jgi:hypothetical protein
MPKPASSIAAFVAALVLASTISACSSPPQAEPMATQTTTPSETSEPEPTATQEPAAAVGTRENPLPIGQVLPFTEDSAFKVGASGPTHVAADHVVLPVVIQVDWANLNEQATQQGVPTGGPFNPLATMGISFVTAAGKSYRTMDNYNVTIDNDLFMLGDLYEGTDVVNANYAVSVPQGEVAGGTWVIENYGSGARVFVAIQ